ncbi:hypothetical protein BGZ63DRAFT_70505 [Mariannaea sp. PMI_226]|nr:hypothetical protein BGZ63DRAFT_70505 [Mariannaea sp. PMI_226]
MVTKSDSPGKHTMQTPSQASDKILLVSADIKFRPPSDTSSWETVDSIRDELTANETLVTDAMAKFNLSEVPSSDLDAIPTLPTYEEDVKQSESSIQRTKSPDKMQSLFTPRVEELLRSDDQYLHDNESGRLYSLFGSAYMKSLDKGDWKHATKCLSLALDHLVKVSPHDIDTIVPVAQNLIDMCEIMGDNSGAESRLLRLQKETDERTVANIEIGEITRAKEWCHDQGFSVKHFNEVDPSKGCSPLARAVSEGRLSLVKTMLSFTKKISSLGDLASRLLLLAADTRDIKMAELLLQNGAEVTIQDSQGRTVLHRCQHCSEMGIEGGLQIAALALGKCQDLVNKQDDSGKTALYLACESGYFGMANLLLENSADPNVVEVNGKAALYLCCQKGGLRFVRRLLQAKANPNAIGPGGCTPLVISVMTASQRAELDTLEIVRELIKSGADPLMSDSRGKNAFNYVGGLLGSQLKSILDEHRKERPSLDEQPTFVRPLANLAQTKPFTEGIPPALISAEHETETGTLGSAPKSKSRMSFLKSSKIGSVHSGSATRSRTRSMYSRSLSRLRTTPTSSNRSSRYSATTVSTAPILPHDVTDNEGQMGVLEPLRKDIGTNPDAQRDVSLDLSAIAESAPQSLRGTDSEHPSADRGLESRHLMSLSRDGRSSSRSGRPSTELGQSSDLKDLKLAPSVEEQNKSVDTTDASSIFTDSDASSGEVPESRIFDGQNFPPSLQGQLPAGSQYIYRQHPGYSQNHSQGAGVFTPFSGGTSQPLENGRPAATRGRGRRSQNPNEEQDPSFGDNMDGAGGNPLKLRFACPFAKRFPQQYSHCNTHQLSDIKSVKQHLRRKHKKKPTCAHCRGTFNTEIEKDSHIRQWDCQVSDEPEPDGVDYDQSVALSARSTGKAEDQWRRMFTIVFPNVTPPSSVYIDDNAASSAQFTQFAQTHMAQWLEENIPAGGCTSQDFLTIHSRGMQVMSERLSGSRHGGSDTAGPQLTANLPSAMPLERPEAQTLGQNYNNMSFHPSMMSPFQQTGIKSQITSVGGSWMPTGLPPTGGSLTEMPSRQQLGLQSQYLQPIVPMGGQNLFMPSPPQQQQVNGELQPQIGATNFDGFLMSPALNRQQPVVQPDNFALRTQMSNGYNPMSPLHETGVQPQNMGGPDTFGAFFG